MMWHKCPGCGLEFSEAQEPLGWPRIDPYIAPLPKIDPYIAPLPKPASFCYKSGYDYDRVQHRI